MRVIRTTVYSLLVALFLVLASGRFLYLWGEQPGYACILLGTGLFLMSAAGALLVYKNAAWTHGRVTVYLICAGLILAVQLTGGFGSFLYFSYLLFIMWISLPSMGGSATELGLVIGFTGAMALLNSSIWAGEGSLITRLMPLLLPALRSLLVPFLFGLAADWLSEREFLVADNHSSKAGGADPASGSTLPSVPDDSFHTLIDLYHRNGASGSTCLFLQDENGYFRLVENASRDQMVISRFMLPPDHRLSRIAVNSREPVLIRADSPEERTELTPYRIPTDSGEGSLWIIVCPLGYPSDDGVRGFLLQDFTGPRPSETILSSLEEFARVFDGRRGSSASSGEDAYSWMARLVAACSEEGVDGAVNGMAGILSEMIPGSTVSVADVDPGEERTSVWVSRGPMARWRRGKVFQSTDGVAGWIVKNRVPCRRSRLSQGVRSVGCFSSGTDQTFRSGSIMGVPVMRDNRVFALIMVEHEDGDAFSQQHERILATVAGLFSLREELAGLRKRFRNISGRDILTGLPGITLLSRHLHHMAKEVQTYGWYVGVLVADIDGFEGLNRELGYPRCDSLLKNAASRFSKCFSDDVFVARIGPDSFAACIPRTGKAAMEAMCQRAADALSFDYSYDGGSTVAVSASIGGVYTHVNRKVLLLTGEAEAAMTQARATAPGSCLVRKMDVAGSGKHVQP